MTCHTHILEGISQKLKVTAVFRNVTLEEIALLKETLDKKRKEKQ